MHRLTTTIAPEVIACIADGREPTVHELARVAARIRREAMGRESAFAWGDVDDVETARLVSLRLAQGALVGGGAQPGGDP